MKPFDLEAAKKGALVCTRDGKKAKIICFDAKGEFPLVTLIDVGNAQIVRVNKANGRHGTKSMSPYDLMMYEKPEYQFKPFDRVLVRDYDGMTWNATLFNRKIEDAEFPFMCVGGNQWRYCIPYEGNEKLLGTTDNPKVIIENPK